MWRKYNKKHNPGSVSQPCHSRVIVMEGVQKRGNPYASEIHAKNARNGLDEAKEVRTEKQNRGRNK